MRILHVVTNADLGGAPRVVTELANRAVRDGHPCAVASVPEGPMWDALDPRVERKVLRSLRREIRPLSDLKAAFELAGLFRSWNPDLIHLHSSKAGVLGRVAAGRRAKRVVYTIHGFDTILKSHRSFLPLERFLARHCGAVVPVSAYDFRNLGLAGIREAHAAIHNGVTDRKGRTPESPAAERMLAARGKGSPVVLAVARLAPPKRFDLFLAAAKALEKEGPRFFWIGDPPGARAGELPSNAEMLGELPEAGDYANLCDIFLLLSDYEGLPMSILEAFSCGKPVLASDVGGIGELVDGTTGARVGNSAGEIIAALRGLLGDPGRLSTLGRNARERYESGFTADRMWAAYRELYGSLVESDLPRGR
ncbi:MAG: glycosyltransferase [Spirochaetales bacterium]|nr:glycosyltransferase [Spirochaetales bacterium]